MKFKIGDKVVFKKGIKQGSCHKGSENCCAFLVNAEYCTVKEIFENDKIDIYPLNGNDAHCSGIKTYNLKYYKPTLKHLLEK